VAHAPGGRRPEKSKRAERIGAQLRSIFVRILRDEQARCRSAWDATARSRSRAPRAGSARRIPIATGPLEIDSRDLETKIAARDAGEEDLGQDARRR
jgi:hypothetical protein